MTTLWTEVQVLGTMYITAATHFFWVFLVAVVVAALAFLVVGPITSIPSLIGVMALVRLRAVALLLIAGFVGAVLSGYAFATLPL